MLDRAPPYLVETVLGKKANRSSFGEFSDGEAFAGLWYKYSCLVTSRKVV